MTSARHPSPSAPAIPTGRAGLMRAAPWLALILLMLAWVIRTDTAHAHRVVSLSAEGSAPPDIDAHSSTGYALGQRHFLGTHERGDTYRWIAATQHILVEGPLADVPAMDNVPQGRIQLGPRLYTVWLAACAWVHHVLSGDPLALSAERMALWEPVITHVLAFCAAVVLFWRRSGPGGAVAVGLVFAAFPPVLAQFLPGVLTPRTWALLLAAGALIPRRTPGEATTSPHVVSTGRAVAAALSLWLTPAIGFPVVLIAGLSGAACVGHDRARVPFLGWSCLGSLMTLGAWLIDRSPWDLAAGELRYVHPIYAVAWLGLGVALDGWQRLRRGGVRRLWAVIEFAAGAMLLAILVYVQVAHHDLGWLYPGASLRRLTSLDETRVSSSAAAWLAQAPPAETVLTLAPIVGALAVFAAAFARARPSSPQDRHTLTTAILPMVAVFAVGLVQLRLLVVATLVAVPLILDLAVRTSTSVRRIAVTALGALLVAALAGEKSLPHTLRRSNDAAMPSPADVQALVHRHIARWMATHHPPGSVAALAPPELSDSLVFHGGCRVLMSTAWEAYAGQVAASRILSSPEATEAEAVIESRGVTHLVLPSWDRVLPLLTKAPLEPDKTTLLARLDVWKLPPYLRPLPYHLPPAPGYEREKLAIFKVVPAQEEALLLSRLAEYFVEMNRAEPAALAAKVLDEAYADDPNARVARAAVWAQQKKPALFEREFEALAAATTAGQVPFEWDRRVQRAIILAVGRRPDLARTEIEACLTAATPDLVFDLTPMQAHRVAELARRYSLDFPSPETAAAIAAVGSEYRVSTDTRPR
ncbi:MAG: hypothetical protein IAE82_17015 [Opitutaceae bacterium]|nr:hypothetical protein [Opitutaceae bacterium]